MSNFTNLFSTANVMVANPGPPSLLEMNRPKQIGSAFVELHVKKYVNGGGSTILLFIPNTSTNTLNPSFSINLDQLTGLPTYGGLPVPVLSLYATYDQGSTKTFVLDRLNTPTYLNYAYTYIFKFNIY